MFHKVRAACLQGVAAVPVRIEVDCSPGLPGFSLVGLPDNAVRESRERVVSALRSCGFASSGSRMTVNLAPADLRKEGSSFDLGLAIGILLAQGSISLANTDRFVFWGELSLDGRLRPVRGALAVAFALANEKGTVLVVPAENGAEAACVEQLSILAPASLEECLVMLADPEKWRYRPPGSTGTSQSLPILPDFSQVAGMVMAKRALEICAAGGHNFLLMGSPGSGKTLCAQCLPGILPPMAPAEALEATMIHSCAGLLGESAGLLSQRPFRAPHHSASAAALVGGGRLRPGEASLAHRGVLFLDELPEFHRPVLECLRQPLEEGVIRVERANGVVQWPARFLFGAAMNPCPCGYSMDPRRTCRCLPDAVTRYRQKLSGPLLDRIDIQVSVLGEGICDSPIVAESSADIRHRVVAARRMQLARQKRVGGFCNAELGGRELMEKLTWNRPVMDLARRIADQMRSTHRGFHRLLKVARTIADLRQDESVILEDVAEASQYRISCESWS